MNKPTQNIAQRSISAVSWNVLSSIAQVVIGFVRSILLARLLPVDIFGIYGLGNAIVGVSSVFATFGLGSAFLHRSPETEDEQAAAAIHFTLKALFSLIWASLLLFLAFTFFDGERRLTLVVLTMTASGVQLTQTARVILVRRVVHRRLALLQLLDALLSSVVAVFLAFQGVTLWALLSTNVVTLVVSLSLLYFWRPVWKPRFRWDGSAVRYFLHFGFRSFLASALERAIENVDDLFTGFFLGDTPLGYYSRSYTFATYPRKILATPINAVAGGTYAELKGQRKQLSRAFFRTNAFLVRTGFLLAGVLALIAPEFIRILLTEKWLPMLTPFRLMLVFTLLDPVKFTIADLFIAVGYPEKVVRTRFIQIATLIAGLFLLGPLLGITGVALAVDIMLLVGIGILLLEARKHVDYSILRMFAAPSLAITMGLAVGYGISRFQAIAASDWYSGAAKLLSFSLTYTLVLLLLERRETRSMITQLREQLKGGIPEGNKA